MSRNARVVEAGMLAAVLVGCESVPVADRGAGTPPPDEVDYIRAVQCGGLLLAMGDVTKDSGQLESMSGLYREWAETRASQAGKDPALAVKDILASKHNFLDGRGWGEPARVSLRAAYRGDIDACEVMARDADYVVVGG